MLSAILWLGGGAALTLTGVRAERARDKAQIMAIANQCADVVLILLVAADAVGKPFFT